MKSAINTLEDKLRSLKLELKVRGKTPNFSQRVIHEVNIEIQEHQEALNKLNHLNK